MGTAEAMSMARSDKLLWQKVAIYKPLFLKRERTAKVCFKVFKAIHHPPGKDGMSFQSQDNQPGQYLSNLYLQCYDCL